MANKKLILKRGQKTKLLNYLLNYEIGITKDTEEVYISLPNAGKMVLFPVCAKFEITLANNQDYLFPAYLSNTFRSIEVYDIDNSTTYYACYKFNPVAGNIAILNNTTSMSTGLGTASKLSGYIGGTTPKQFGLSNRTGSLRNIRIICS